jgi:signal peptidase I
MTQWRVSPDGERQYLGDDGYWYVAASQQDAPSSPPPQMAEPTPRKRKSSKRVLLAIVIVVAMLGAGGAIFVATRSSTSPARYFTIPSGAMEPTLQIGDTVKVENGAVDRGSIVIFSRPPAENCGGPEVNDLVKRVIGLPGDVIS